jgi:hypothetical protein
MNEWHINSSFDEIAAKCTQAALLVVLVPYVGITP